MKGQGGTLFAIGVLALAAALVGPAAHADYDSTSFGLGLSYSKGPSVPYYGGAPIFGYGAGYNSIGALGQVCASSGAPLLMPAQPILARPPCAGGCQPTVCSTCNICASCGAGGGFPGGIFPGGGPFAGGPVLPPMPALPPLPPPTPHLPPHLAMPNMGWGPGFGSMPGLAVPGINSGSNCVPCGLGMSPAVIAPVPGGPYLSNGNYDYARLGVHINEWEKNDTASIIFALGSTMPRDSAYPVMPYRYENTSVPTIYGSGVRDSTLIPRPEAGH